ncbi:MAG: T9SS type A sorting domain-containing protein [bacterium]
MKNLPLLFLLTFVLVKLYALPSEKYNEIINRNASYPIDIGFVKEMPKDSYAVAAGFKAILEINGDFRGLAPTALNSTVSSRDGDTIQVICGKADGGVLSGFLGVYYTCSFDGGATWSTPELITSMGPFSSNYCEIAVSNGQFPYVVADNSDTNFSGVWFTTDQVGAGSGSWTTPILITDTVNYAAYIPSVAVNKAGDKVSVIASDLTGEFGSNYSSDYGNTWNIYNNPFSIGDSILKNDLACARWGTGDTIYAIVGMSWQNEVRKDIANTDKAFYNGFSMSTDAGASWSAPTGLFYGSKRPNIHSVNGDTITYYTDTLKGNGKADSIPVKCYLDESTGLWADERESIDSKEWGFGTWWYWWDAEYFTENHTLFYAIPMADLFFDYYIQPGGDLYTFPWQGRSLLFGFKNDSSSQFIYDYIDLHDGEIFDSMGRSSTWRGNLFSANIVFDRNSEDVYIIYQDYVDTAVGESSIEVLRIQSSIERATVALNAASYVVEAPSYLTEDGYVHITMCAGSLDSIYYKAIDLYDASLDWTFIGFSNYSNWSGIYDKDEPVSQVKANLFVAVNEIRYNIMTSDNELIIYDVSGKAVFRDKGFKNGTHKMSTENLESGVYFIKLRDSDITINRKAIIIK